MGFSCLVYLALADLFLFCLLKCILRIFHSDLPQDPAAVAGDWWGRIVERAALDERYGDRGQR